MTHDDTPPWVTVTHGSAPILLLAPHGGRRHDVRVPGKHKVNDLLTAKLTHELAAACGASVIVNELRDRNELDLNRLSQVRRDARWMIYLLADMLGEMVSRYGRATVLVLHGWNVTQVACDVGIGMRELAKELVPVRADTATASDAFIATRVRPLQHAAADAGIAVTIGSRYPAAHPNNLLQIFRGIADPDTGEPCPVAALCRTATIEAAQLELAIPLRWPGPRRDRFLALLAAVFTADGSLGSAPARERPSGVSLRASNGRVTGRRGVQFCAGDLLIMTSIDAGEHGPIAGRLVISPDRDHLALFTGELGDPASAWSVPPLTIEALADGGTRIIYEGPLVKFPSLTPFLDLERGLADGALIEARVDITFHADASADRAECDEPFGDVRGQLYLDGRAYPIAARGSATHGETLRMPRVPNCRVTLPASLWGALSLSVGPGEAPVWRDGRRLSGRLVGTATTGGQHVPVEAECDLQISSTRGTIVLERSTATGRAESLRGSLERLIPVRRPGRDGTVIETTFALVRVEGTCLGWAEFTVVTEIPALRSCADSRLA